MAERTRDWQAILGDEPVNEARIDLYRRLLEAREQVARAQYVRGVRDDVVQAALDAADARLTEDEQREDLYLSALGHFVGALGGRLEVRAVFGEEAVVLREEVAESRRS